MSGFFYVQNYLQRFEPQFLALAFAVVFDELLFFEPQSFVEQSFELNDESVCFERLINLSFLFYSLSLGKFRQNMHKHIKKNTNFAEGKKRVDCGQYCVKIRVFENYFIVKLK